VLREVSLVVPSDVTLTQLTMTAPTAASEAAAATPGATAAQEGFVIQGSAFSYDSVARLLSRLALVPDLSDVTLSNTSSGSASGSSGSASTAPAAGGVQFNITAAVAGPPAAPPVVVPAAPVVTDTTAGA
jgi:hypothetical protein